MRAVRHLWQPFLAIQAAMAAVVVAYYQSPALQRWSEAVLEVKHATGYAFAFVTGAVACALIPEIAKAFTGKLGHLNRHWVSRVLFTGLVYGIVAVEVDVFYPLQASLFGAGTDFATLSSKVALDMGLFSPLLSIPTAVLLFAWRKRGFSFAGWSKVFTRTWYRNRILPALIPCWAFWIPVLYAVYSMPTLLQYLVAVLAEGAWSLVFVFMATDGEQETS